MAKVKETKPAKKPSSAFMKPVQPDEMLAKVVGDKPLPRTELTKKLWEYNQQKDQPCESLISRSQDTDINHLPELLPALKSRLTSNYRWVRLKNEYC